MDLNRFHRGPLAAVGNEKGFSSLFPHRKSSQSKRKIPYTYCLLLTITVIVLLSFYFIHFQHTALILSLEGSKDSIERAIKTGTVMDQTEPISANTTTTTTTATTTAIAIATSIGTATTTTVSLPGDSNGLAVPVETSYAEMEEEGEELPSAENKITTVTRKIAEPTQYKDPIRKEPKFFSKPLKQLSKSEEEFNKLSPAQQKRIRNSRKQSKFHSDKLFNYQPEWGYDGTEKYIEIMPTNKIPLKKDRRVVLPNLVIKQPVRPPGPPSNVLGQPRALSAANKILQLHPFLANKSLASGELSLDEVMVALQSQPACHQKPLFITMATVGDDLYWQLIENFVYSMAKFDLSNCVVVICVSDAKCMKLCETSFFPCYNYHQTANPLPSVMEQIAKVKLFYVPLALNKGVDVFLLDLDVGFLGDPNIMVKVFAETPIVDIFVQEDYIFIMNRTKAGWKSWFTEPLPNIGLFLCRGNNRTARVFEIAWEKYLMMDDDYEKSQPGKDQNHVLEAMRIGRGTFGLKYAYFSNYTAPLMDKLVMNHGVMMELGGELMESFLIHHHSLAIHTTCYEKSTKVMGLKAANAFWNPKYYDPLRPTITKTLIYLNEKQVQEEVRSLLWLGVVTGRNVIIPNLIGSPREFASRVESYQGHSLWPGFRVARLKESLPVGRNGAKITILEPGYYWRIARDYDEIPPPKILYFNSQKRTSSVLDIRQMLLSDDYKDYPRIILAPSPSNIQQALTEEELSLWANDSIGLYRRSFPLLLPAYQPLPSLKDLRVDRARHLDDARIIGAASEILKNVRNCVGVFDPPRGNRTCFQICK